MLWASPPLEPVTGTSTVAQRPASILVTARGTCALLLQTLFLSCLSLSAELKLMVGLAVSLGWGEEGPGFTFCSVSLLFLELGAGSLSLPGCLVENVRVTQSSRLIL